MTPRLEKDVSNVPGKAGLSAWLTIEDTVDVGDWCQKIDVAKLAAPLAAYLESGGHLGIVPVRADGSVDAELLAEWAVSRGKEPPHLLTNVVLAAIVEPIQRLT